MGVVEGISKSQAEAIVEAVLGEIRALLARGKEVSVPRFGSFSVTDRSARRGRNPATAEEIVIPASRGVRFRASQGLREALNSRSPGWREVPSFSEVVLTAPDIDADVFRQVAAAFRRAARRVTLYASAVDTDLIGHFYYGDNRTVLSDVFYLLRGKLPKERLGLELRRSPAGIYWAFVP